MLQIIDSLSAFKGGFDWFPSTLKGALKKKEAPIWV